MMKTETDNLGGIVAYYDEHAALLCKRYQSITFERVHGDLLPFLPEVGGKCLDIGAGSGRDAAYLIKRGLDVTAVEPSAEMRRQASRMYGNLPIHWIDDRLPPLDKVLKEGQSKYDFVLVSAVWMHIPLDRRESAMNVLRKLVKPYGIVAISIRSTPPDGGKIFFPDLADQLPALAAKCGFRASLVPASAEDVYGRDKVHWTKYMLVPLEHSFSEPGP